MAKMEPLVARSAPQEETVTIPLGHNTLILHVRDHSWTAISTEEQEIVREEGPDPVIGFSLQPGSYTIRTDGSIEEVSTEALETAPSLLELLEQRPPIAALHLSSDAPDRHVVDGIGEIAADGVSYCTITVEAVIEDGTSVTEAVQGGEIFLRTTGGTLMDADGAQRIRSVRLESGRASFRIVSEEQPKLITITAFGRGPVLAGEIQLEFI